MTAYIDNIIIVGTPEEIQEFIELRNTTDLGGSTLDVNVDDEGNPEYRWGNFRSGRTVTFGKTGHGFVFDGSEFHTHGNLSVDSLDCITPKRG